MQAIFQHNNMITKDTVWDLTVIFSDAALVDLDFSDWTNEIRLCLVSDHFHREEGKSRPILLLTFKGVRRMECSFNHHEYIAKDPNWRKGDHFVWDIYESKIERGAVSKVTVSGSRRFPVMTIEFEDVTIEKISSGMLTKISPNWADRNQGLARPGIRELHRLVSKRDRERRKK